jgi:prolyl oligopeptidase
MKMHAKMSARALFALVLLLLVFPRVGRPQSNGLQKLFSDYYEFQLREDPGQATFIGRAEYNDRWDDPSPEHRRQFLASLQLFLGRLHRIPETGLAARDRLSYELLDRELKERIEDAQTISTFFTVNHMVGEHLDIFSTMAVAPANTVKDYENEVARLRALPKWVDQTIAAANLAIAQEKVQPRLTAEREVDQLNVQMEPDPLKSPLLAAFTKFPDSIPAAEQERLRTEAVDAYSHAFLPAWSKLRDYVSGKYLPAARNTLGLSQAPGGPEMYAFLVRQTTTTNYTPEQIHEIGLKEVARIQSEMAKIRQQLNFTGTAEEFSDQVLNAPRFRFHSEAEILAHGRDIAKRIDPELPRLFKVLPRMTYGVAPIPADRARTSSEYYEQPALDGSRAGFFYMRTVDPEKLSSCCMESTILHESVPGHHLQIALSYEISGMPDFRKISEFTAYTEGWALYAETLGPDLHMYETPYEMYGFWQGQILRAARLVVDTGIHTKGWSREQAIDYMVSVGADASRDFIASEVDRYIAWPGQALAYKVGQLKILELRALAQKELGPKFDIREFHDVVLRNGTIPLDILEEQVRNWIAQSRKSDSQPKN